MRNNSFERERAMQTITKRFSPFDWISILFVAIVAVASSCTFHHPRKLAPLRQSNKPTNEQSYVDSFIDSPEMFPRERALLDRRMELQLNWATQEAIKNGNIRVRALAPPLQITGDPNMDVASTHEILIVADDLKPGEVFTNSYEIRVGPKPDLATICPAQAANSLAQADQIYGEEQLTRITLDMQSLKSSGTLASNIGPTLQLHLADITSAHTNQMEALLTLTNSIIADLQFQITNMASINSNITALSSNRTAELQKGAAANTNQIAEWDKELQKARGNVAEAEAQSKRLTNQLQSARSQIVDAGRRFESARSKVNEAMISTNYIGATILAEGVLQDFWKSWLTSHADLSELSNSRHSYNMNSAMTVAFRVEALKGLQEITIEVIRRIRATNNASAPGATVVQDRDLSILKGILGSLTVTLQTLNGLLLADKAMLDDGSRSRFLKIQNDRLAADIGRVEAMIVVRSNNQPERKANSTSVLNAEKASVENINKELNATLRGMQMNLTNLEVSVLSKQQRALGEITKTTKLIARAVLLVENLRREKSPAGTKTPAADLPQGTESTSVDIGNQDPNGTFGMIQHGDLAVFRFNVLRGVVSTTAFLLADDNAAGLFGQAFADQFYVAQTTFRNPNDKPILIYGNTMRLVVRMDTPAASSDALSEDGQWLRKFWWATYEPLDYDSIRRMLETMQDHSWQHRAAQALDLTSMGLGVWGAAANPGTQTLRVIAAFGGVKPGLKDLLEADLNRYALNFREKGLNSIEEIPAQGTLTRCVFLPKGPIYGDYVDIAEAGGLPLFSEEDHRNPFGPDSRSFGKRALLPAYIHNVRREEVYVEGKRILVSDPLTPTGK
jgi:hypothetical protein